MRYPKLLAAVLTAAALSLAPAMGASAATPTSANPLVQNGEFKYNGSWYSINVTPAAGSPTVTRDYYRVASTYSVRVTKDEGAFGKLVYSGKLGYTRAAYLHTKVIGLETAREGGLNLKRSYSITTYLKKVTSFSASYDRARLNALLSNYREERLRADVTTTAQNVRSYLAKNADLSNIKSSDVVSKRDGYWGYSGDNVSVRLFVDPSDSGKHTFEVVGLEKPDLYQSVHDSATGAVRSGPIDDVTNLD